MILVMYQHWNNGENFCVLNFLCSEVDRRNLIKKENESHFIEFINLAFSFINKNMMFILLMTN